MSLKSKFFFVFFPLFVLTQSGFSQDYFEVYKNYLPEPIVKRARANRKAISLQIKIYGEFDPNLIYFYLENLKLKIDDKISDPKLTQITH